MVRIDSLPPMWAATPATVTQTNRIIDSMDGGLTIMFVPAGEGGFTAFIPEVPGAISEGETMDEAREMVLDALRELIDFRREEALKATGPDATIEHVAAVF